MPRHAVLSCVSPAPSTRQQALPESTPLPVAAATGTASLGCPDFAQMLTASPCNKPRAKWGMAPFTAHTLASCLVECQPSSSSHTTSPRELGRTVRGLSEPLPRAEADADHIWQCRTRTVKAQAPSRLSSLQVTRGRDRRSLNFPFFPLQTHFKAAN